jgi:hypothetical protein
MDVIFTPSASFSDVQRIRASALKRKQTQGKLRRASKMESLTLIYNVVPGDRFLMPRADDPDINKIPA